MGVGHDSAWGIYVSINSIEFVCVFNFGFCTFYWSRTYMVSVTTSRWSSRFYPKIVLRRRTVSQLCIYSILFFIPTNAAGLFATCSTDSSFTVFGRDVLLSAASSLLLACLTGLTGFGWMDLAGLTGFSSRTFLRSLPWREHTCEVALLLEVLGSVGSVNTRLASAARKSSSPLVRMIIIVTLLCFGICRKLYSLAR